MTLVAITGGIGAGKSTVLSMFGEMGFPTLDADDVAHALYEDKSSPAFLAMLERWGNGILDSAGGIDRKKVAERVFGDDRELSWLNALLHPLVRDEIAHTAASVEPKPLFCAIPLLYESGWHQMADKVVGIWCSPDEQRRRLRGRGWSEAEIDARIAAQLDMDEKLKRADFGIINDGSRESCREQCRLIVAELADHA